MKQSKLFFTSLALILLIEELSFLSNLVPSTGNYFFAGLMLAALVAALIRLEYGVYIIVAELIIGSHGYLSALWPESVNISLRHGLFIIVMSVWAFRSFQSRQIEFWHSQFRNLYLGLGLFFVVGLTTAWAGGNDWKNIFFDADKWLYFLLLLPLAQVFSGRDSQGRVNILERLGLVAGAALTASWLKGMFLLYIFSHYQFNWILPLYKWVRDTRVGEITYQNYNFYRIFLPSQVYSLLFIFPVTIYLCLSLSRLSRLSQARRWISGNWREIVFLTGLIASTLISFSRSFWVGAIVGGVVTVVVLRQIFGLNWRASVLSVALTWLGASLMALAVIFSAVNFPYPYRDQSLSIVSTLSERLKSEAAVASRWLLMKPLTQAIISGPLGPAGLLIGRGFGTTVTYKTLDPRVLQSNPSGLHTTSAFEWGWLDIVLKIGLAGAIMYLVLIWKIFQQCLMAAKAMAGNMVYGAVYGGVAVALVALTAVNFFTPFLNHPLGIGFVIFASSLVVRYNESADQPLKTHDI